MKIKCLGIIPWKRAQSFLCFLQGLWLTESGPCGIILSVRTAVWSQRSLRSSKSRQTLSTLSSLLSPWSPYLQNLFPLECLKTLNITFTRPPQSLVVLAADWELRANHLGNSWEKFYSLITKRYVGIQGFPFLARCHRFTSYLGDISIRILGAHVFDGIIKVAMFPRSHLPWNIL